MCFQSTGDLLTTNWPGNAYGMSQFDTNGNLLNAAWVSPATFSAHPESCAVDSSGDVYVGQTDGAAIYKFSSTGTLLNTYYPTAYDRGIDWIDLASDQCTIYYNGEGSVIRTFNVCTNAQGPDFASETLPTGGPAGPCFALRIRPGGDVLAACSSGVLHIDNTGALIHFYPASGFSPSEYSLFALNIDPDGSSFWTAGYSSGNVYHINITNGAQLGEFNAPHSPSVAGLAIFGEVTQGCGTNCGGTSVPEFPTSSILVAAIGMLSLVFLRKMRLPHLEAS
jgi:outer membrane protein assembly factor BamB